MSAKTASAKKRDFYAVLGVSRRADEIEIKRAFRAIAMEVHPDRNPDDHSAEERFKEANEAYAILSDPDTRAAYDRFGHDAFVRGTSARAAAAAREVPDLGEVLGGLWSDLVRRSRRAPGRDLRYTLELDFAEAAFGVTRTIRFPSRRTCATCTGSGHVTRPGRAPSACEGCDGSGFIRVEREFTVTIPPGATDGSVKRVPREGEPGKRGGTPGDLQVIVRVRPHPLFVRHGSDVETEVPVTFPQAALGAIFDVPTLDGKVKMRIPPGTQSGRQFRLRGKGIPRGDRSRGDHLVRIVVETPEALTPEQRKALEQLSLLFGPDDAVPAVPPHPRGHAFATRMKELFERP